MVQTRPEFLLAGDARVWWYAMTDEGVHSVHTLTAMLTWLACTVINVDFTIGATVTRLAVTIVFVYTMCTGGTMLARIRYALINILLTVCAGISENTKPN